MSESNIKAIISNSEYSGWKEFSFRKSLGVLAHEFSFAIPDKWEPEGFPILFSPGDEVKLFIDDIKLTTGFIDEVEINESSNSHSVRISGRSKTADLVDCSYEGPPYSWKNITLGFLAIKLCAPFDIQVFTTEELPKEKFDFKLKTGESPYEAIDRKARDFGILLGTNADGHLLFTNNDFQIASTKLQTGFNIIDYTQIENFSDRFSKYIIKGQDKGRGRKAYSDSLGKILGTARDDIIKAIRNRPKIMKMSSSTTAEIAQKKAAWEAGVRYGKSLALELKVNDFYQTGFDLLWNINNLIDINIKNANLDQRMLISSLEFSKSPDGSLTLLQVVRPEAYLRDPLPSVKKQKEVVRVAPVTDPVPEKNNAFAFGKDKARGDLVSNQPRTNQWRE